MDLYGSGQSIGQGNSLSSEVRQANNTVSQINNSLAEELDNAKAETQGNVYEQQAINMYKGATSGTSLINKIGIVDAAKKGLTKGGKFLPTSMAERLAGPGGFQEGDELLTSGRDIQTAEDVKDAAKGLSATEDDLDIARFAEGAGAESTLNTATAAEEGLLGVGVPSEVTITKSIADQSTEVSTAEKAGETGEIVKDGAKIATGAEALAAKGAGVGLKAVGKAGIAGVGGALDIYKDISRGSIGDNWEQKVGNVGNIIGSGLEIAGALTAWTGLGVGAEALGAAISLGSTGLEAYGDDLAGQDQDKQDTADVESQKQNAYSAQQVEGSVGRTQ